MVLPPRIACNKCLDFFGGLLTASASLVDSAASCSKNSSLSRLRVSVTRSNAPKRNNSLARGGDPASRRPGAYRPRLGGRPRSLHFGRTRGAGQGSRIISRRALTTLEMTSCQGALNGAPVADPSAHNALPSTPGSSQRAGVARSIEVLVAPSTLLTNVGPTPNTPRRCSRFAKRPLCLDG
jgi:hypothetical protein